MDHPSAGWRHRGIHVADVVPMSPDLHEGMERRDILGGADKFILHRFVIGRRRLAYPASWAERTDSKPPVPIDVAIRDPSGIRSLLLWVQGFPSHGSPELSVIVNVY